MSAPYKIEIHVPGVTIIDFTCGSGDPFRAKNAIEVVREQGIVPGPCHVEVNGAEVPLHAVITPWTACTVIPLDDAGPLVHGMQALGLQNPRQGDIVHGMQNLALE